MLGSVGSPHRRAWTRALLPVAATALAVAAQPAGAHAAPPAGQVLGGVTAQDWPIVIALNRNGRQVIHAVIGMDLKCTSGDPDSFPYRFEKFPITKRGRFSHSFPTQTQRLQDGTPEDFAGGISGKLDSARTAASGSWQFKETFYDNTGAVSDTCEAGNVGWSARA